MDFLKVWLAALGATIAFQTIMYLIGLLRKRRYDIVDVGWGPSFVVAALSVWLLNDTPTNAHYIIIAMVALWAGRLARHILGRWLRSREEDPRYTELRSHWPKQYVDLQVFVRIFVAQALLACLVSLPVLVVLHSHKTPSVLMLVIGTLLWVCGFVFEAIGDAQLKAFIAKPENRGKLMTEGLWSITRHPNYFGEITMWWALALIAITLPYGWLGVGGATLITILITKVSGIPPAEKRAAEKPGWEDYKQKTAALIPFIRL
jgi:steroid 5-alpha reductase family enzyme